MPGVTKTALPVVKDLLNSGVSKEDIIAVAKEHFSNIDNTFDTEGYMTKLASLSPIESTFNNQQIPEVETESLSPLESTSNINNQQIPEVDAVLEAMKADQSRESANLQVQTSQGLDEDEANLDMVHKIADMIKATRANNHTDAMIQEYFTNETTYDPSIVNDAFETLKTSEKTDKYDYPQRRQIESQGKPAQELADTYRNVYGKQSTFLKQIGGYFNDEMADAAGRDIDELNAGIVTKLQENGIDAFIDLRYGHVMMREGSQVFEVDSSTLDSLALATGEIGGGIAGAVAGARTGLALTAAVPIPGARIAGGIVGGIVGGALGAAGGKGIDLLRNSIILSEELSTELYKKQMIDAGLMDGVFGIIGGTLTAGMAKGVMKAYRFFRTGNIKGADKALKLNQQLNQTQINEIEKLFRAVQGNEALEGLSREEINIKVVALTQARAQTQVGAAVTKDPELATKLAIGLHDKAAGIKRGLASFIDPEIKTTVRRELKIYEKEVKALYTAVKNQAINATQNTDFIFDLKDTAITPVLNNIREKIKDPFLLQKYARYAGSIEAATQTRTFGSLLDLRAAVNKFKFGVPLDHRDTNVINKVINKIDSLISKGALKYMGPKQGKVWLNNFKESRKAYSEMKKLQGSKLHKILSDVNSFESDIKKALIDWSKDNDIDNPIYKEITSKLSSKNRVKLEASLIDTITDKYTIGKGTDSQVIDFIKLNDELKGLNLITSKGKYAQEVFEEQAKLFRNNRALASITGHMVGSSSGSFGTSIWQKFNYGTAGAIWDAGYKYIPWNNKAAQIALVHHTGRLLKNPMNVKGVKAVLKAIPKEGKEEVAAAIKKLQIQVAKEGNIELQDITTPMYKHSPSGKLVVTEGKLGQGVYVSESLKKVKEGSKRVTQDVDMSRLADVDDISALLGKEVTIDEIRKLPNLKEQLIERGYLGIKYEDKAMLFLETTMGVKTPKAKPLKKIKDKDQFNLPLGRQSLVSEVRKKIAKPVKEVVEKVIKEVPNKEIKDVVKRLKNKELGFIDAVNEAKTLGFNIHKRGKTWVYNKIKDKK